MNTPMIKRFTGIVIILIFMGVFLKNAWISEDAYINFRSIQQFQAGNGPRWNLHERVQVYTSPAWFWLCAVTAPVFSDPFLQVTVLSFTLLLALIVLIIRCFPVCAQIPIFLLMLISRAFFDFTSSGLENSLCYLVIACFVYHYLQIFKDIPNQKHLHYAMLFAGLTVLCRHDLILLIAPAVLWLLINQQQQGFSPKTSVRILFPAVFPGILWTTFSIVYYGFPFPNTAYAKLGTGIPRIELLQQGLVYLKVNLLHDGVTLGIILIALITGFLYQQRKYLALSTGIVFYLFYLVWIGGDFMLGRFLAVPFIMSLFILAEYFKRLTTGYPAYLFLGAFWLAYSLFFPHVPMRTSWNYTNRQSINGIADERGFYFKTASLKAYLSRKEVPWFPLHRGCRSGYEFTRAGQPIMATKHIGFFGYWSGLDKPVIDTLALADPFLARLPVTTAEPWRPGHFLRDIPVGYIQSVLSNKNLIEDVRLRQKYGDIHLVTSGPLWTCKRWRTIVKLNLGV
ncbi:hypothetical protein K8T06_02480 [bacterium]|nr:hypothetical protein [bacterium]